MTEAVEHVELEDLESIGVQDLEDILPLEWKTEIQEQDEDKDMESMKWQEVASGGTLRYGDTMSLVVQLDGGG